MAKAKRFADGGITAPNTYPFANQNIPAAAPDTSIKVGATTEPLETVADTGGGPTPTFKKGGMVSRASKRADGCATKGRTKGRYV